MLAIVVEELGGPEVLRMQDVPTPEPQPEQILVDVHAAGVNFMDIGARRRGPAHGRLPFIPGVEAAGTVSAVGENVEEFAVGDRVAWVYAYGSYAEKVAVSSADAVPLPAGISDDVAAAVMMQGITAHHFATQATVITPGDVVVVHAGAGGVGQLLTQFARMHGATVISIVSRAEKVRAARDAGADKVVVSTGDQFIDEVLDLTGGRGADYVYDGGGETTFRASMAVTRPHGTLLYYGAVIGDVPTVTMTDLPNSIKITYPVFRDHIRTRPELLAHTATIFGLIESGDLSVSIGRRYPLSEANLAHRDLESRSTTGKLLLKP